MPRGIERRAQFAEYGQLFAVAFVIAVSAVWVGWMGGQAAARFVDSGIELSLAARMVVSLRWAGLLLLPAFLLVVVLLKRRLAGRVATILSAYMFAFAAVGWLVVAMITLWQPLSLTIPS